MENSPKAKEAFTRVVEEMANREVQEFAHKYKSTALDLKKKDSCCVKIDNFGWEVPMDIAANHLPTLFRVLSGSLTNNRERDDVLM